MGEFCHCGVSIDLHPGGDSDDPVECGIAARKADLLSAFSAVTQPAPSDANGSDPSRALRPAQSDDQEVNE
jgi:hypothetical protein